MLQKHGGLWFYDESFVISHRRGVSTMHASFAQTFLARSHAAERRRDRAAGRASCRPARRSISRAVPTRRPRDEIAAAAALAQGRARAGRPYRRPPARQRERNCTTCSRPARRSRYEAAAGHRRRRRCGRAFRRRAGGDPEGPPARGRHRGDRHRRLSGRPSAHSAGRLEARSTRRSPAAHGARPARPHRQPVLVFAGTASWPGSRSCAPAASPCRSRSAWPGPTSVPALCATPSAAASMPRCAA